MVGVKGFEPSTPWSQTKCANQTALHPEIKALLKSKPLFYYKHCAIVNNLRLKFRKLDFSLVDCRLPRICYAVQGL